jgi:hypothetical protein
MKLTLREIFLLVALVAMGCGWWVEHRQNQHWQVEAKRYFAATKTLVQQLEKHVGEDEVPLGWVLGNQPPPQYLELPPPD